MNCTELQKLCENAGQSLSEDAGSAAVQAISGTGDGFITFKQFVAFCVNPSGKLAEVKPTKVLAPGEV